MGRRSGILQVEMIRNCTTMSVVVLALGACLMAQTPANDIPRALDGKPDLNGIWNHPYVPDMTKSTENAGMSQQGPGKLPFTAKAAADFEKYDPHVDGDYTGSCLPFGYLRSFNAPYPIQVLQTPQYIGFLFEQNTWFHV